MPMPMRLRRSSRVGAVEVLARVDVADVADLPDGRTLRPRHPQERRSLETPGTIAQLPAEVHMTSDESPAPETGFVITLFLVVADSDRSCDFYQTMFGAEVLRGRHPVIMKITNSCLILNTGGGPPTTSRR
jgi:hypothetical protein